MTPEQEVAAAQESLKAAKVRVAAAEDLKLTAAKVALQEREVAIAREQQKQREYNEAVEAKFAAKKAAEDARELSERNAERVKQAQLEAEFSKREEETRVRLAHEAKVRKIQEETFNLEQESKRIEAEALAQKATAEVPAFEPDPDADGTIENSGMDQQAGGLETAGQLNPLLRRLLRSPVKEAPEFVPDFTQAPQPLTNEEVKLTLYRMYSQPVVDAAIAHLSTLKGVQNQNLQVYLSVNHKRVDQ